MQGAPSSSAEDTFALILASRSFAMNSEKTRLSSCRGVSLLEASPAVLVSGCLLVSASYLALVMWAERCFMLWSCFAAFDLILPLPFRSGFP